MKKIFFLFSLLVISHLSFSQGIIWEPTIEGAFKKAKATNKLVFIECYHPQCPICLSLEPTFKTTELGDFYNKNFVSFKLNLSDASQVKFLDSKNIRLPGYPLFTYFDANKNLIHIADVGEKAPAKDMNALGQVALDPDKRGSGYKKRYESGERDQNFLISYAYLSRVSLDTTRAIELGNEIYRGFPKDQLGGQLSWVITKKVVMDVENGFFQYWIHHLDVAKSYEGTAHPGSEINTLGTIVQASIFSKNGLNYNTTQVNKLKEYMTIIGAGQYASAMTWQHEARALFREGQQGKAVDLVNTMSKQFSNSGPSLVYLSNYLVTYTPSSNAYSLAQSLLGKAKPLSKTSKELAEWNYQSARVYQKMGDKTNAQKALTEAKKQATLGKIDAKGLKQYDDLSAELK